jgi:glyceraldehyde-3-phosphate dehydrogenase/erythrose-4-phosphate dehydrogenase
VPTIKVSLVAQSFSAKRGTTEDEVNAILKNGLMNAK